MLPSFFPTLSGSRAEARAEVEGLACLRHKDGPDWASQSLPRAERCSRPNNPHSQAQHSSHPSESCRSGGCLPSCQAEHRASPGHHWHCTSRSSCGHSHRWWRDEVWQHRLNSSCLSHSFWALTNEHRGWELGHRRHLWRDGDFTPDPAHLADVSSAVPGEGRKLKVCLLQRKRGTQVRAVQHW